MAISLGILTQHFQTNPTPVEHQASWKYGPGMKRQINVSRTYLCRPAPWKTSKTTPPWRLSQQQISLCGDPQNTWRHGECSKRCHKPRGYSQTGSSEPDFTTISPFSPKNIKNNGKTKGFIAFCSSLTACCCFLPLQHLGPTLQKN